MNFREYLENIEKWPQPESGFDQQLRNLYQHLLNGSGHGWGNEKWHYNAVNMLKAVGLDKHAQELELYNPSEEDVAYGKKPMTFADTNVGKMSKLRIQKFQASHRGYQDAIEAALDDIYDMGEKQFDWKSGW
ncbi:MAG: hypothetical protein ACW99G_07195 [Candidatus Thorarchaeota archaeon]|jgi:hypothetical protein